MILHTINKSPASHTTFEACLKLAAAGSGILFIEEGVYAALAQELFTEANLEQHKFYALEADLRARGITDKIHSSIEKISYSRFVELSLEYSKVQSWS